MTRAPVATGTPYPGLRPFREEEALYFFGQDVPLATLIRKLSENKFVAILGISGCGKSSLLKAGLLADIRSKKIRGPRPRWLIGYMKPGANPLDGLIAAVLDVDSQLTGQPRQFKQAVPAVPSDVRSRLLVDGYGLARYGHDAALAKGQDILIVVDQFEELFRYQRESATNADKDRAALFVQLLLQAVKDPDCHISVVITMRSEFLGDCGLFFGLAEQVNEGTFLLPKMTRDQIEAVIVGAAEEDGFEIDPNIVQELLNETEKQDDGLPLLQHALRRIHLHWQSRGGTGPVSVADLAYFESKPPKGTLMIKHHLDDHLDSIYRALSPCQRRAAKLLFRLLSDRDSRGRVTRRPLSFPDIVKFCGEDLQKELRAVIETFRDEGKGRTFLTPGWPTPIDNEVIDISHECLLRRWDRLQKWIGYEQYDAEQFRRLSSDADAADLQALKSGEPRKPLEGMVLEKFVKWRRESSVVSANWALRYEGPYNEKLGRKQGSFVHAVEYLDWSEREAQDRIEKARKAQEDKIRDQERAGQAELKATLANERRQAATRRTYALLIALALVLVVVVTLSFAYQSRTRADQIEQQSIKAERAQERARTALVTQSAAQQKHLNDELIERGKTLEDTIAKLGRIQSQLTFKGKELELRNRSLQMALQQITEVKSQLEQANGKLEARNGELQTQTDLVTQEQQKTATALSDANTLKQRIQEEEVWLKAVILSGEAFNDSYSAVTNRRTSVLDALDQLEAATQQMGPAAEIKELFGVRKAGLKALGDAIVPELVVWTLQAGPGQAACYDETTGLVFSLLRSGGLRYQSKAPGILDGTVLFIGSSRAGDIVNRALNRLIWLYRRSLYPRQNDRPEAMALSDNCHTAVFGSQSGLIDQYDVANWFAKSSPLKKDDLRQSRPEARISYMFPASLPLHRSGPVEMVRLNPTGKVTIASFAGHGWAAWNLESEKIVVPGDEKLGLTFASFSPQGRWLILADASGKLSRLDFNASHPTPVVTSGSTGGWRQQADVAEDGSIASFQSGASEVDYSAVDRSGTLLAPQKYAENGRAALRTVRLSPDGKQLAVGRDDGSVDVWLVDAGGEPSTHLPDQSTPLSPVIGLSWSASGYLTVLHESGTVRVWELAMNSRMEHIRSLLRQIDSEARKVAPGDTRLLGTAVRDLFVR